MAKPEAAVKPLTTAKLSSGKWEYSTAVELNAGGPPAANALGAQGWELVGFSPGGTAWFKRFVFE